MGYYANYSGTVITNAMTTNDIQAFLKRIHSEEACVSLNDVSVPDCFEAWDITGTNEDGYVLEIFGDEKYYADDVYDFLDAITPYTKEGEIEYVGEDTSLWRFIFRNGAWYEESGSVTYAQRETPISPPKAS